MTLISSFQFFGTNVDKYADLRPQRQRVKQNTCCHTRMGKPKQRWHSEQEAKRFLKSRVDKYNGGDWLLQEPYPCRVHKGDWHLRKKRTIG